MLAAPWLPALQRMAWCQSAPRDHSIMVPPVGEVEVTSKIISKIVRRGTLSVVAGSQVDTAPPARALLIGRWSLSLDVQLKERR